MGGSRHPLPPLRGAALLRTVKLHHQHRVQKPAEPGKGSTCARRTSTHLPVCRTSSEPVLCPDPPASCIIPGLRENRSGRRSKDGSLTSSSGPPRPDQNRSLEPRGPRDRTWGSPLIRDPWWGWTASASLCSLLLLLLQLLRG